MEWQRTRFETGNFLLTHLKTQQTKEAREGERCVEDDQQYRILAESIGYLAGLHN